MRFIFLLFAIPALGQSVTITVKGVHKDSITINVIETKTYVPFPEAPVFSNSIAIAGNQTIFASTLAGKTEHMLTGKATNLTLNGIGGTTDQPIKFSWGTIEGTSTTQRSVRTLNATRFFELHNMKLTGNDGGVMLSGSGGVLLSNVEIVKPAFAGYWCNTGGGVYERINSSFLRVTDSGGEGVYLGNTSKTNRSHIKQSHHKHLLVHNAGWDGIQLTSVDDLLIENFTVIGAGLKNQVGQNTLMQLQMCNGLVQRGIMTGGTSSLSLFAHGLTIKDCYVSWTSDDAVYIGEATGEPQLNGKPLIIEGVTFNVPGSKPLFTVAMRGADVIIRNCVISDNRKGLFTDARGTVATNKLIDGGGNRFVPASEIPAPQLNPDGTVKGFYFDKGFGYRTP